ncbi:hypothetical protein [Lacticaseibacillus nasuensis]|uniref:hypothetical protein n=1 Tax=Lacticaseibacillus nasuensis TaxID=944671 RepID=UPI0006D133A9|nr:hypothetical protein [Lacticaseibacillus nasuensis]
MRETKVMQWALRVMVIVTAGLLVTNFAAIGIGLMAVDVVLGVIYEMRKTACDRRQMHHIPVTHRL